MITRVDKKKFEKVVNGEKISLYTLKSDKIEIQLTNYGARIVSLIVNDENGEETDVVLGYKTLEEYMDKPDSYFGAVIGRCANRTAEGKFSLDGVDYQLNVNNGPNHLHGGPGGFHNVVWKAKQISDTKIELYYQSADGEESYPGNLTVKMTYSINNENRLTIDYSAVTDSPTIVNLTHHSFFNLSGEGDESVLDHVLKVNSDSITPVNENLIPTGELMKVENTAFDFNTAKAIGDDITAEHEQLQIGNGYDHCFVLDSKAEVESHAASIYSPKTKIQMDVYTDQPGVQLYTGNFLDASDTGKSGKKYPLRSAFCLEAQHFADAINKSNFKSTRLDPGQKYTHICSYEFSVKS
jgi:aldose 1-epimerase